MPNLIITALSANDAADNVPGLAKLLLRCVGHGASVGFVEPFTLSAATEFWQHKVLPALFQGGRILLVAHLDGQLVGTVQLDFDTPANQPHRAEARKLLVDPSVRRQGVGRRLMDELEKRCKALGRHLITLDTRTGDAAEPLYAGLGYQVAGVIPGYCLDPAGQRYDSTTVMYKAL